MLGRGEEEGGGEEEEGGGEGGEEEGDDGLASFEGGLCLGEKSKFCFSTDNLSFFLRPPLLTGCSSSVSGSESESLVFDSLVFSSSLLSCAVSTPMGSTALRPASLFCALSKRAFAQAGTMPGLGAGPVLCIEDEEEGASLGGKEEGVEGAALQVLGLA